MPFERCTTPCSSHRVVRGRSRLEVRQIRGTTGILKDCHCRLELGARCSSRIDTIPYVFAKMFRSCWLFE
jgi:hypothetical protein